MGDSSELDGVFVGEAAKEKAAVKINISVDSNGVRCKVGSLGTESRAAIASGDRRVLYFQRQIIELVRSEAHRHRPITPNLKEKPAKRGRKPVPVPCPDCGGYRSFDCDTCEGAGVVPG